jgi:beta-glucosidase-like glycosyl hydrolase
VPSCANDWLLGTLLRDSWQFDGYVTSDCDADSDVFNSHHYTPTASQAVAAILNSGVSLAPQPRKNPSARAHKHR